MQSRKPQEWEELETPRDPSQGKETRGRVALSFPLLRVSSGVAAVSPS